MNQFRIYVQGILRSTLFIVYMYYIRRRLVVLTFILAVMLLLLTAIQGLSGTLASQGLKHFQEQLHYQRNHTIYNKIRKIRILCLIMTCASRQAGMVAVNQTWAKRCDKYLFVYGHTELAEQEAESILYVPVPEGRSNLTAKVRFAFLYAYRTYKAEFDWIMKCDDDTYVIIENLRYLLSHADPKKPGYIGFHMKNTRTRRNGYMSGGGGYVISSTALHQLIHKGFKDDSCWKQDGFNEDFKIGLCLAKSDVPVLKSLDMKGRETFHPTSLQKLLYPPHPVWIYGYSWNQVPKFGSECCSKYSISFHKVSPGQHFLYDQLLYKTEVFGLKEINKDRYPVFDLKIEKPAY